MADTRAARLPVSGSMATMKNARPGSARLLALVATLAVSSAGATSEPRWSRLEFSASKFLMTAHAGVGVRERPAAGIVADLLRTPEGRPVQPGANVLELAYQMSGFGRESTTTLWADPVTGASLQQTEIDGGRRPRLRTYRFTDIGAWHFSRWPATAAEQALAPGHWSERTQGLRAYSPGAVGQPVTSAIMLLWLASAGNYQQAGDRGEVLVFSRKQVNRVTIEVAGRRTIRADYAQRTVAGLQQRRGNMEVIVIHIHGQPVDPAGDDDRDFELLGLQGNLELLLEPVARIPLQLSGAVKIAGQVTIRLQEATLR